MVILSDFPSNELEFKRRFSSEEACRDYWIKLRWPDGFQCPRCGHKGGYRLKNREEIQCADPKCGRQTSPRAGTVLHNSSKPIEAWLLAMFHMATNKQGISAVRLQTLLGFGSYRTALRWLRELRRVMAEAAGAELLTGEVEVDENFLGGVEEGARGPADGKQIVAAAVERRGNGCGRARFRIVTKRDEEQLCGFVCDVVAVGSIVATDGAQGYAPLPLHGYVHDPRKTTNGSGGQLKMEDGRPKVAIHLPRVHRVFSLMSRVVLGCLQGSVGARHLQGYLDEYCFRLNRRDHKWETKAMREKNPPLRIFQELARRAASRQCVPYWRSSGRLAPDAPTFTRKREWERFAAILGLPRAGEV